MPSLLKSRLDSSAQMPRHSSGTYHQTSRCLTAFKKVRLGEVLEVDAWEGPPQLGAWPQKDLSLRAGAVPPNVAGCFHVLAGQGSDDMLAFGEGQEAGLDGARQRRTS